VHHYERFCSLYDLAPWPASQLTLRYYCTHAYCTLSHATILVYLAAIRHHHLQLGHRDPLAKRPLLAYLCRGIKRHQGIRGRVRLPLSAAQLAKLQKPLRRSSDLSPTDKMAIWAALSLGFHALLRVSEFTTPTTTHYSPTRHLLREDVRTRKGSMTITIKAAKNDPYRATCTLPVAATGTSTCPVAAMVRYLSHGWHGPSLPLFTLASGEFLTRAHLTTTLRRLLQATGLSPQQAKQYGSHSLRIGAATEAAAAGLPTWLIQAAGRWKSTAYQRYIRSPRKALLRVAPALAAQAGT
jgi:hypothetical protein